jgi:hypothetical protein
MPKRQPHPAGTLPRFPSEVRDEVLDWLRACRQVFINWHQYNLKCHALAPDVYSSDLPRQTEQFVECINWLMAAVNKQIPIGGGGKDAILKQRSPSDPGGLSAYYAAACRHGAT